MLNDFNSHSILVLSSRPWHNNLGDRLSTSFACEVLTLNTREQLTIDVVNELDPTWIFVPHWSYIIPSAIWQRWPTVIFHMTDLPYGRGGSPLQNLIQRGHKSTKVSALRCTAGLDAGPIYLQEELSLEGSAEEIFLRADLLIELMIETIVRDQPEPCPQQGEPVLFSRRTPEQSNLSTCPSGDVVAVFDQIRMLDAEGYPHAFLEFQGLRFEFRRVSRRLDGLHADVKISKISTNKTELG